jgi:hypothetical protein
MHSLYSARRSVAEPTKEMLVLEVWYVCDCMYTHMPQPRALMIMHGIAWFILHRDSDETETGGSRIKGLRGLGT